MKILSILLMKFKKGESNIIIIMLAIALMFLVILPLINILGNKLFLNQESFYSQPLAEEELLQESLKVKAKLDVTNNTLIINITNDGNKEVSLRYLILLTPQKTYFIHKLKNTTNFIILLNNINKNLILKPAQSSVIKVIPLNLSILRINITSVALTTDRGNVFRSEIIKPPLTEVVQVAPVTMMHTLFFRIFNLNQIAQLSLNSEYVSKLLSIPSPEALPGVDYAGMRWINYGGYYGALVLKNRYINVKQVEGTGTDGSMAFGTLAVGYDPKWLYFKSSATPEYVILLTWDSRKGYPGGFNDENIIVIDGEFLDLKALCPYGYRLKILGFRGEINLLTYRNGKFIKVEEKPPYIKLYGYNPYFGIYYRVYFNGSARDVRIYCRSTVVDEGSYEPYFIIGDFDNNNNAELLYITEDICFGWAGYYNDDISILRPLLDDVSTLTFRIVFKEKPLPNVNYTAVSVVLKYYFHDNEGSDEEGTTFDAPILSIGLYDPELDTILVKRDFTFRELTRYEDTYPYSWSYQITEFLIPIPDPLIVGKKTYYIVLELHDPYGGINKYDDVDLMLGIEFVGVIMYARD